MISDEIIEYLQPLLGKRVLMEVRQDIHLDCDDWSHQVTASIDECFEVAEITTVSGYDGDAPQNFIVLIAGKAV